MSRRSSGPEPLHDTLRWELDRLGGGPPGSAGIGAVVAAWPAAVGDAIARNAWPARIARDGTLVVHASSSAWAFELSQLQADISARLGEVAPGRLKFVVGPIPEPAAPAPAGVPDPCRSVPRPTPADARRGAEIAVAIADPGLRELVARAAAASLARAPSQPATADPSDTIESA